MPSNRNILALLRDTCRRLDDDHSLDTLAQRAGWSRFHLHRAFKRVVGETPKQYTQRLRLERAAAALAAGQSKVVDIAFAAGFQSHEVFVRAFRRHFGRTPKEYRVHALARASKAERVRHLELVGALGPCVRLFHVSVTPPPRSPTMPTAAIVRKEIIAQPILFIRRKALRTQLQPVFAECFGKLYGHGMTSGLAIAGQPITRYVEMGPGLWTIDCAMPLAAPAPSQGEMQAGFLHGGAVAQGVHMGPYEQLPETYAAMEQWIEANGLRTDGAPWECYVTDPADYPDPADWKTEVSWPVAK